jgi:hypothetical protein
MIAAVVIAVLCEEYLNQRDMQREKTAGREHHKRDDAKAQKMNAVVVPLVPQWPEYLSSQHPFTAMPRKLSSG